MEKFTSIFESKGGDTLVICDVQKEFTKFQPKGYVEAVNEYSKNFKNVYQIWDGHKYENGNNIIINGPSWKFKNEKENFRKVYGTTASEDVKDLCRLANKVLTSPKEREKYGYITIKEGSRLNVGGDFKLLKKDENGDNHLVKISNRHNWFYVPKNLSEFLKNLNSKTILIGGAGGECLEDVFTAMRSYDIDVSLNKKYVYSAKTKNTDIFKV
jgi:hypothetical protein